MLDSYEKASLSSAAYICVIISAPAAYAERVLVCQPCYVFLMSRMKGTNTEIVE